ncbi:MlaD family protein [Solitalea sp. MAHUQ-68]|uniref:MlaD family protein n=1 Tax=Solitalea agri TaxID=2953739 RepID=A0A9X2JE95_9SPHI|nr:MlaD family protein [Solitalea agri]MCO4293725.1 MlaD family protein [Solitalea agri]
MKIANETKIGILTALAITCLILGYNYLRGNDVFSSTRKFYVIYDRVDGLTISRPVLVNGFQIGRVARLDLQPDHKIKARLDISSDLEIPKNSIAEIQSPDLLSGKAIVLKLGNSSEMATEGFVFSSSIEASIMESLNPLKDKAASALVRLDSVLTGVNNILSPAFQSSVQSSFKSVEATMKNIENTSTKFGTSADRLNAIMANVESITQNLEDNNDKINSALANIDNITDQVAKGNLQETLLNTSKTMAAVNAVMTKIQKGEGSIGLLLNDDQLYNNLTKTSADLDKLMVDFRLNPKRYVHFSMFGKKPKNYSESDSTKK